MNQHSRLPNQVYDRGTFGISTAYHLAKRGYTNITCIDRHPVPSLDSAAYDLNKIIRTEYDEPLYTELALEALDAWRQPEWDGIFHETVSRPRELRNRLVYRFAHARNRVG